MIDPLDELSVQLSLETEDSDNTVDNDVLLLLHEKLYDYEPFVILINNCTVTTTLDLLELRKCILHIFNASDGLSTIDLACTVVLQCLPDNITEKYFSDIVSMSKKLCNCKGLK